MDSARTGGSNSSLSPCTESGHAQQTSSYAPHTVRATCLPKTHRPGPGWTCKKPYASATAHALETHREVSSGAEVKGGQRIAHGLQAGRRAVTPVVQLQISNRAAAGAGHHSQPMRWAVQDMCAASPGQQGRLTERHSPPWGQQQGAWHQPSRPAHTPQQGLAAGPGAAVRLHAYACGWGMQAFGSSMSSVERGGRASHRCAQLVAAPTLARIAGLRAGRNTADSSGLLTRQWRAAAAAPCLLCRPTEARWAPQSD